MPPSVTFYVLGGVLLEVRTDVADDTFERAVPAALARLGAHQTETGLDGDSGPVASLQLQITPSADPPSVPSGARQLGSDEQGTVYGDGDAFVFVGSGFFLRIRPEHRSATLVVPPASGTSPDHIFFAVSRAVLALYCYHGRSTLHAACVVAPSGTGYVLVGPSGSGKSTLALALVHEGWGYLTDDLLLLAERDGRAEVHGLLSHFSLFEHTAERFPEIMPHVARRRSGKPKLEIAVRELYPNRFAERCHPSVLVLPRVIDREVSRVVPVAGADVIGALLNQTNVAPEPRVAQRQMEQCRLLAAQCRTYRLEAGRDVAETPGSLGAILDSLGDEGVDAP